MEKNPYSPEGLVVVASSSSKRDPLPEPTEDFCVVPTPGLTLIRRRFRCGHKGVWHYSLNIFGQMYKAVRQKDRCPSCELAFLRRHTLHCALCGLGILPGDPIALYGGPAEQMYPGTTMLDVGYPGCLRWSCCPSGGFFAGHWTEHGFRSYFSEEKSEGA